MWCLCFFFFKQKTAYEMRISDWSSDVCSSDLGLFLVTSAVGRAWCGYACPQTVWTDLFQHVDRLIDGDRNAQIRLANGPWKAEKIAKRTVKYAIYQIGRASCRDRVCQYV